MSETVTRAELAKRLGVSKARISQLVRKGLPLSGEGKIDPEVAAGWIKQNVESHGGGWGVRRSRGGRNGGILAAVTEIPTAPTVVTTQEDPPAPPKRSARKPKPLTSEERAQADIVARITEFGQHLPALVKALGGPPAAAIATPDLLVLVVWQALGDDLVFRLFGPDGPPLPPTRADAETEAAADELIERGLVLLSAG